MRRYLASCLSVLIVFPGCASYTARPAPAPKIVAMPFSRIENSVMVAVDPYIQPDRQMEVFDADLKKSGVFPLYLLVENRGDRELYVQRSTIVLEVPDGRQISPVQSEKVARELERKPTAGGGGGGGGGVGGGPGGAFGLVVIGLILLAIDYLAVKPAEKKANEARIADYMNKDFHDVVLSKNALAHGFVYFMPPAGTLWSTKARLALRFVDKKDGASFVIRVPVSESGFFKEGPVDTKKEEPPSQ